MTNAVGDVRTSYCSTCNEETSQELYHNGEWICLDCDSAVTETTYTARLSFREWMDVCHALGYTTAGYRAEKMKGQANKYDAITDKIAGQLKEAHND